jgi:ABC-type enterochelin transport system substrate-binding protein
MNQRQLELIERLEVLQTIIDFHVNNQTRLWQSQKEFEEYIDDILDEMNEAKTELKELGYYD